MIHVHAVLSRLGLGNRLFPWARAEVFRHRCGARMLQPVWFKPAIGPILRAEAGQRLYWRLFRSSGYVTGWEWLRYRGLAPRWPEPPDWFTAAKISLPADGLVLFRGLKPPGFEGDYFEPLRGHAALLSRRLREIARPGALAHLPRVAQPFIGVHIRQGDLAASLGDPRHPAHVPLSWYADTLAELAANRELSHWPVHVMTDGGDEVRALLRNIPRVQFVDLGNALANMLHLSRAGVFIATGYSTFSRWISFLGGMPTLYHPGYVPPGFGYDAYHGPFVRGTRLPEILRDPIRARAEESVAVHPIPS